MLSLSAGPFLPYGGMGAAIAALAAVIFWNGTGALHLRRKLGCFVGYNPLRRGNGGGE